MCKLLIILGLALLFSGCGASKLSHSKVTTYKPIISKSKLRGCRALSNGYLVCPKIARR